MTHDNAAWDFMCDQVIALKTALAAEKADHTETQRDQQRVFAEYRAEKAALTAAEKVCEAAERFLRGADDPMLFDALIEWRRTKEGA